ncbi:MAG: PAS domain-containing protein, partial [Gammaproteobacteria bacterium]|nr:PAS domain-containing protein [Gammaproteobacteria bacterium]
EDTPLEYLYVTNTNNTIFAHSFTNGFPKYLLRDDYSAANGSNGPSAKYATENGLVFQYSEPLIDGLDITLHLGVNQSQIESSLTQNSQVILLMSSVIVIFSLLFGYYWNKQITSPLNLLAREIEKLGSGKAINQSKFVNSPPEIKLLLQTLISSTQKSEQMLVTLRESEAKFSQLVDNISLVFWLGSVDWQEVYYVSPAYENFWGHSPEELYANGLSWMENIHPDDKEQVYDDIPADIDDSQTKIITFRPYRVQKLNGDYIWVSAKAYPIRDDHGKVVRIAGIAQDITQYVDLEDTLKRTQKMDALGKLTGGIAHDFNNMLGVILGYTELLQLRLKDDPTLLNYVDEINIAGQRSANLTSKLLTFSRKRPTKLQSVNLNEPIKDRAEMLEKTVTARIKVKYHLAEDLWHVSVDRGDFEDALVNMAINAMHAIEGSGEITITTSNTVLR